MVIEQRYRGGYYSAVICCGARKLISSVSS